MAGPADSRQASDNDLKKISKENFLARITADALNVRKGPRSQEPCKDRGQKERGFHDRGRTGRMGKTQKRSRVDLS